MGVGAIRQRHPMARPRCNGRNKQGVSCGNRVVNDSGLCWHHRAAPFVPTPCLGIGGPCGKPSTFGGRGFCIGHHGLERVESGEDTAQHRTAACTKAKYRRPRVCQACAWRPHPALAEKVMHAHHIIPLCAGGSNKDSNLIILCPTCHAIAHALFGRKKYSGPTVQSALVASIRAFAGSSCTPRKKPDATRQLRLAVVDAA